jgi:hypothetical protein
MARPLMHTDPEILQKIAEVAKETRFLKTALALFAALV